MIASDPFEFPFEASTTLEIQDVRLRLASNSRDFIEYAPLHAPGCEDSGDSAPESEVNVLWGPEAEFDPALPRFAGLDELDWIGTRMRANEPEPRCTPAQPVRRG